MREAKSTKGKENSGKELHREEKTKQGMEWGEEKKNHLTPFFSRGQRRCKLDIKTQIAFRQVTRCQKILDACREETTIPISLRENNIFIFRFFIEWKHWGICFMACERACSAFTLPQQKT